MNESENLMQKISDEVVLKAQAAFSDYEARNGRCGWRPQAPSAAMRAALEAALSSEEKDA